MAGAMGLPLPGDVLPAGGFTPSEQADVSAAEQSLYEFIRQAWDVLEPGQDFIPGWHLEALALHLESLAKPGGPIKNLMVNVPPGTMKSLALVFFSAWLWGPANLPETRILAFSYGGDLATRDNQKVRNVIESDWYQRRWGHRFKLVGDQNQKTKFENDKRGWRQCSSVGGKGTGEHPDILIIDDPHKARDSKGKLTTRETDAERTKVLEWYSNTITTRGKIRGARRVLVMQRLHEEDLCGYILNRPESIDWTCIVLPMRAEPERMATTPLGWNDPRDAGDLLWPGGYSEIKTASLEQELGSALAAGQLQQRPTKAGGEMFKRGWFRIVPACPTEARRVRYWDKASTAGGGAFTVGVLMAQAAGQYYIENVIRQQLGFDERNKLMLQTAQLDAAKYGNTVQIVIEQEPSAGKETATINTRELTGFPVYVDRVSKAKEIRPIAYAAQAEAGNVAIVAGAWNEAFLDEHEVFPMGKYLDQVDAATGAFTRLAASGWMPTAGPLVASGDDDEETRKPFDKKEIAELPPFLRDVLEGLEGLEDDDDNDGWGRRGRRG